MIDSRHKMILASGRFSGTTREQLTEAFKAFTASPQKDVLVIHFHGGLVSKDDAEGNAERLSLIYQNAGGYPFFVIWQTGLGETLKNNWREIVNEEAFSVLVKRTLQFVIGKLDKAPDERGATIELPTSFAVEKEIQEKPAENKVPYEEREVETLRLASELTAAEQAQFEELLESDAALTNAAAQLTREGAPELNPKLENEFERARAAEKEGTRALLSVPILSVAGVRILARTLKRFAKGSGHGIYTTIVEEVLRELKGDLLGGLVWGHMKKDALDSLADPSGAHGGTALLEEINRIWQKGRKPRIALVGHSAGAIYICRLLEKAGTTLPADVRFEVVFLAPACSFKLIDHALAQAGDRIAAFHSFAMEDELEKRDAIFPPVYMRSLLYFVSGILEEDVDLPLVGMARYHMGKPPFDDAAAFPEIARAQARLANFPEPWIWTGSSGQTGLSTHANKHSDFDNEERTLQSVARLIAREVAP